MKRHIVRFILAVSLIAAPFLSAGAGVSVMSDEDLGAVSARGFENVAPPGISGDQTNFNSVVFSAGAQNSASGVSILNAAASSVNIGQNIASVRAGEANAKQKNEQTASTNTVGGIVAAVNPSVANADSVWGYGSQTGAQAISLANLAASSANIGQNLLTISASMARFSQVNRQEAHADGSLDQGVASLYANGQANNAGSVLLDGAQNSAEAASILNAAASGANIGQNIAKVDGNALFAQVNFQKAKADADAGQLVLTGLAVNQTNNNGSVDLIDSQNNAKALSIASVADSAANIGQNIAKVDGNGALFAQVNLQKAKADVDAGQAVLAVAALNQTNNNGSVELLGGGSQNGLSALSVLNAAASGANVGQNIAKVDADGALFAQANLQKAKADVDAGQAVLMYVAANQTNNNGSVGLIDSQNNAKALSIASMADSAANVGQNIAKVDGYGALFAQANLQKAKADVDAGQAVLMYVAANQTNNNGSVDVAGSQDGLSALSVLNAAASAGNVGQNIAKVDAYGALFAQANLQDAKADADAGQAVLTYVAVNETNNNGSVGLIDSQNNAKALSIASMADSAANVGQNIAKVDGYGALFAQANLQKAKADVDAGQAVLTYVAVNETNNNGSVGLIDSQNNAKALSIASMADSAANVGQNIAKVDGYGALFAQANLQKAKADVDAGQAVLMYVAANQTNNNGSVDVAGSQDGLSALSVLNAAASAGNVGQNIAKVDAYGALFAQANLQDAKADADAGQAILAAVAFNQTNNNGSVNLIDSQNNAKALSLASIADSAANVGQNIAKVDADGALFAQANVQKATVDADAGQLVLTGLAANQTNNNSSVDVAGSQDGLSALSVLNAAASAGNVGQNIAKVDAYGALFAQANVQKAKADADAEQFVGALGVNYQTNNNGSVELIDSQNKAKALSLASIADSAANIGQNVAKVDAQGALFAQANIQDAKVDAEATQTALTGPVANQTNNNGSIELIGSQNGLSALSVLNAAMSAVNMGQNIAYITGKDVTVSEVNYQTAKADADATQAIAFKGGPGSQSNNESIILNGSQMNTSALAIANVAGAAVNIGQNIAYITGAKGMTIYQTSFQKAW